MSESLKILPYWELRRAEEIKLNDFGLPHLRELLGISRRVCGHNFVALAGAQVLTKYRNFVYLSEDAGKYVAGKRQELILINPEIIVSTGVHQVIQRCGSVEISKGQRIDALCWRPTIYKCRAHVWDPTEPNNFESKEFIVRSGENDALSHEIEHNGGGSMLGKSTLVERDDVATWGDSDGFLVREKGRVLIIDNYGDRIGEFEVRKTK